MSEVLTRDKLDSDAVIDVNGRVLVDMPQEQCSVLHHFAPGICIREVHLKASSFAVGHAQKFDHLNVMLKGAVAMLEDGKVRVLRAPLMYVGKPGRKIGFILEDTVWQNIYATDLRDPEAVEEHFIDKTEAFKEYQEGLLRYAYAMHEEDRADYAALLAELHLDAATVRATVEREDDQIPFETGCAVSVRDSAIQGKGLYSSIAVKAGEIIAPSRLNSMRTPAGRYTNHSRFPNAVMRKLPNGDIYLVALRDIRGCEGGDYGEEITVNYRDALAENYREAQQPVKEPRIIGEAHAFDDVKTYLKGHDVVLFAQMAKLVGEEIPDGSLIYNMEPLYDDCPLVNLGFLEVLRKNRVIDYQKKNVEYLRAHGIPAVHVQYGYFPELERIQPAEQDIDVLFFGGVNDRRIKILKELEASGMNCKIITYGVYGDELDALVARAKVVLNVHYQDVHPLEVVRLNYLLANKKFVVTERGWDEEDNALYAPGVVFAKYADLVETCRDFLSLQVVREEIASAGQKLAREIKVDLSSIGGV